MASTLLCHFNDNRTDEKGHTVNHSGTATYAAGKFSNGLVLAAGSSASVVSNDLILGTGDYTIDFWTKITSTVSGSGKMLGSSSWNTTGGIIIEADPNSTIITFMQTVTGGGVTSYKYTGSTNTLYHVAVARASGTTRFFVDGSLVGTDTTARNLTSNTYYIGGTVGETTNSINGLIDELYFRNTAAWTSNFTPPTYPYETPLPQGSLFFGMNF